MWFRLAVVRPSVLLRYGGTERVTEFNYRSGFTAALPADGADARKRTFAAPAYANHPLTKPSSTFLHSASDNRIEHALSLERVFEGWLRLFVRRNGFYEMGDRMNESVLVPSAARLLI